MLLLFHGIQNNEHGFTGTRMQWNGMQNNGHCMRTIRWNGSQNNGHNLGDMGAWCNKWRWYENGDVVFCVVYIWLHLMGTEECQGWVGGLERLCSVQYIFDGQLGKIVQMSKLDNNSMEYSLIRSRACSPCSRVEYDHPGGKPGVNGNTFFCKVRLIWSPRYIIDS